MNAVIIGIGMSAVGRNSAELSFKELMFETAQKAYLDAGIVPAQVDSFVTCAEDLTEGISIFDEYTPDQLGAVHKPMHTLTEDGLHGIADAVMQLRAGIARVVVVEAHSKHSNLENPNLIIEYALDPVYNRPLAFNPHALAALEMNCFLHETGIPASRCSEIAARNRVQALKNVAAAYGSNLRARDIEASPYVSYPLRAAEMAAGVDGCVVAVLAVEETARQLGRRSVRVRGVGFAHDSPTLESRDWVGAQYARRAAALAYRQAAIDDPAKQLDLVEVDDRYAYKQLQHLIALGISSAAELSTASSDGDEAGGFCKIPVNVSGGSLGMGYAHEASGLYRLAEIVYQLRGEAGPRQIANARTGLAQSWRGIPTTSGAVVILGKE
jgi:acetyl-CoA C-acetyltransferase